MCSTKMITLPCCTANEYLCCFFFIISLVFFCNRGILVFKNEFKKNFVGEQKRLMFYIMIFKKLKSFPLDKYVIQTELHTFQEEYFLAF